MSIFIAIVSLQLLGSLESPPPPPTCPYFTLSSTALAPSAHQPDPPSLRRGKKGTETGKKNLSKTTSVARSTISSNRHYLVSKKTIKG
jgi:hypothetical protein